MRYLLPIALTLTIAAVAFGQTGDEPPIDPVRMGLEADPLEIEALGLTFHPPARAQVIAERISGRVALTLLGAEDPPKWQFRVQPIESDDSNALQTMDEQLQQLEQTDQTFKVIENRATRWGDVDGRMCWLELEASGVKLANGWLILPTGDQSFLVFTIQTLADDFVSVRPTLEAAFSTIELQSVAEIAEARTSRLAAGKAFLGEITLERLRALTGQRRWFRLYVPADVAGGVERERGYTLVEVMESKRGALEPNREETTYNTAQHERGLMIRIQGRIVVDAETNEYYDSIALYWLAWDQSSEAWSVRATRRQGDASYSEGETGLRTKATIAEAGAPQGKLTIIKSDSVRRTREPYEWAVPSIYLSQGLGWVLGQLLVGMEPEPLEMSYYMYNYASPQPRLSLREDDWTMADDNSGNWILTTRLSSDAPPLVSIYGRDGRLVSKTWSDGSRTEPSTPEEIRRKWRAAGLNISRIGN